MIQKKYSILVTNCFYSKINRTAVIPINKLSNFLFRRITNIPGPYSTDIPAERSWMHIDVTSPKIDADGGLPSGPKGVR